MSMIASAYKLTSSAVQDAKKFLDQNDTKRFWQFMKEHEMMTFAHSAYVLGAVIPYLRARGISFPGPPQEPFGRAKGVLLAGRATDYKAALLALFELSVSDDSLRKYYGDLYGHDWEEAASAMREGFAFLQRAMAAINSEDEYVVVSFF